MVKYEDADDTVLDEKNSACFLVGLKAKEHEAFCSSPIRCHQIPRPAHTEHGTIND